MLGKKVNFKKAKRPLNRKLLGDYVILEPINPDKHALQLYDNFSQDKKTSFGNILPYGPFKNIKDLRNGFYVTAAIKILFFMPYMQNDTNSIAGWQVICA